MYVNLDMEQKTLQPFPSLQQGLHNFESVHSCLHSHCSQVQLSSSSNCQLNPNNIWLVSWLLAISSMMQCCCHTKWSFRYRSWDKWRGVAPPLGENNKTCKFESSNVISLLFKLYWMFEILWSWWNHQDKVLKSIFSLQQWSPWPGSVTWLMRQTPTSDSENRSNIPGDL